MTFASKPGTSPSSELQLEFHGCIVPLPSDNLKKPATLTKDQTRQLAEIIFNAFKEWYEQ